MTLSKKHKERLEELAEICKETQGEYLEAHHGPGSWATTYSTQFIIAAAEIYYIYEKAGSFRPISPLSSLLQKAGVKSCRGCRMGIDRTEYLYKTHLASKVDELKNTF